MAFIPSPFFPRSIIMTTSLHGDAHHQTRRYFLQRTGIGLGAVALASLLNYDARADGLPGLPHFAAKAKRVIYLFQSGAPSQMDLFDHKPRLAEMRGAELPDSVRR